MRNDGKAPYLWFSCLNLRYISSIYELDTYVVTKLEITLRLKNVQRLFSTELNRTSGADVQLNLLYDYSSFLIAVSILRLGILRREHVRRLGYRLAVY